MLVIVEMRGKMSFIASFPSGGGTGLVVCTVFKAVVGQTMSRVGSIPMHLRHLCPDMSDSFSFFRQESAQVADFLCFTPQIQENTGNYRGLA